MIEVQPSRDLLDEPKGSRHCSKTRHAQDSDCRYFLGAINVVFGHKTKPWENVKTFYMLYLQNVLKYKIWPLNLRQSKAFHLHEPVNKIPQIYMVTVTYYSPFLPPCHTFALYYINSTCTYVAHFEDLKDCWCTVLSGVQLA